MATSGYIEAQVGARTYLKFSWTLVSQSIPNNTSTITWEYKFYGVNGGYSSVGKENYTLQIDNELLRGSLDLGLGYNQSKILLTGTSVIPHEADGSKTFRFEFSQHTLNGNKNITWAENDFVLPSIGREAILTNATNFTDEENPFIVYLNTPGDTTTSLQACISFTGGKDDIPYRDIDKTGTKYTFELTDEERAILRKRVTTGNSVTVRFYLKTVIGGLTYYNYLTRTLTLVNYEPTLSPTVRDVNNRTVELTGNSNTFIKYFSNASFTTGAAAKKEATIASSYVTCGSQTVNSSSGIIEGVDSNTYYFGVTDSRGFSKKDFLVKTLIPYIKLTANLTTEALTANGRLPFTVKGKYYNGSFGAKNNTMEVEYSVRDEDGNFVFNSSGSGWVPLGTVTPMVDEEGNYTYSYTISGLDYRKKYELTVNVIDELSPIQTVNKIIASIPVFDWGKNDFNFNVPVYLNETSIPLEGLDDYVTIQGYSGDWFYRQWYSGKVELSGTLDISNEPCNIALGGWYRTAVKSSPYFPFTIYNPRVTVSYESDGYGALVWATTSTSEEKPFDFYLIRPTSSTGVTGKLVYHVIGDQGGQIL